MARRYNLNRGLLQTWRRQALRAAADQPVAAFVPVRCDNNVLAPPTTVSVPTTAPAGTIDIEIGRTRVRVKGAVDLDALRQVLSVIGQGR